MRQITNNELYALSGILSGMTVSGPTIPAEVTAKLIDALCEAQDHAERLRKKAETIRTQTRPKGVEHPEQVTDEQRAAWGKAMAEQLEILGTKAAEVKISSLTGEEFRLAIAGSTMTGAQAALLRRALVDKEGGAE